MNRYSIKITGESGRGLLTVGEIIMKALKRLGFYVHADREYPSLIKGGHSNSQIDFSLKPIRSLSSKVDILVALDRPNMEYYLPTLKDGGILVHGYEKHHLMPRFKKQAEEKGIRLVYIPAREIAFSLGGNELVINMVLIGLLWKILGLNLSPLEEQVRAEFASKPKFLEIDLKCITAGHEAEGIGDLPQEKLENPVEIPNQILIDGHTALSLGAIHCGVRTYYAYPMSPASNILTYIARTSNESKIVVKQAEDEITAAQMAIGSMYAGTRALVATSGGGYDLMTESVSLAGIIENPLVIVIAQRPGPGTGLPTWTGQGDLDMAIHSSHGEFTRVVIGCSDPTSAFEQIQHAMNIAEKFQIPVIVLTDKFLAEAKTMVQPFSQGEIQIERGLVTAKKDLEALQTQDRYKITENGLSKRWIPGSCPVYFFANGDEHGENGTLTEEADQAGAMYKKRVIKEKLVRDSLPDPIIYGPKKSADISFIGWGSVKGVMEDVISAAADRGIKVNFLHYEYVWPLRTAAAGDFFLKNKKVCLIEGNFRGQLGEMIEERTGNKFHKKLLKWNGRQFLFDEVMEFIEDYHIT